jgi:hypothetical protein
MDDSSVSQVSLQTVLKQQAYLLFYIQTPPKSQTPAPALTLPQSSVVAKPLTLAAAVPPSSSLSSQDSLSTECDQLSSSAQKRKFSESSSALTTVPSQELVQKDLRHTAKEDEDEDDDDLVGEMLFLAKKHRIDLPPVVVETKDVEEEEEVPFHSTRLPPKRFGIFR